MSDLKTEPRSVGGFPIRALRVELLDAQGDAREVPVHGDRLTVGTAEGNDLVLADPTVSRYHLEVTRRADRILVTDLGSTNGTLVGPALFRGAAVAITAGTVIGIGGTRLRLDDGKVMLVDLGASSSFAGVRGRSPAMRRAMRSIERLAAKDVSVLLFGESGTGKEILARALHEGGPRAGAPFVALDCGAIAPGLFANELFGHERGAFTGAEQRHPGAFERAQGGTLLLDEVGELPLDQQTALLGVLERRRLRRIGGRDEIELDVRVVAATHRDLRAAVNAGTFRLDLYYRLAVVTVEVPPLRDRPEDIAVLVEHFLREEGSDEPVEAVFPESTMRSLAAHAWPGNVRELRNVVAAALATGEPPGLPPAASSGPGPAGEPPDLLDRAYRDARRHVMEAFETRYLRRLLERAGGNVREAARVARMDRSYLIELLTRHGLR